jgi:hypothetical protein
VAHVWRMCSGGRESVDPLVSAFLDRSVMIRYLNEIAWETEVWVADAP